ncbi:MAG: YqhA family protein [Prevotella sp.]|nr:YqhA family protein [Prevotella sp.]
MKKKITTWIENVFESFLFNCRFITILAVLGSLLASLIMFVNGSLEVMNGIGEFYTVHFSSGGAHGSSEETNLVATLVASVDEYLFATVLLVFSMGIYELFISEIDPASRRSDTRPNWMRIESIDDLKSSLGKVILMVLIVSFFKYSLRIKYENASDLLFLGIGVLLVSAALYLTHAQHQHKHKKGKED